MRGWAGASLGGMAALKPGPSNSRCVSSGEDLCRGEGDAQSLEKIGVGTGSVPSGYPLTVLVSVLRAR